MIERALRSGTDKGVGYAGFVFTAYPEIVNTGAEISYYYLAAKVFFFVHI
jgi:hypothetical protein